MYNIMDDKDKIVIANIINLAKGLGLKVISEGVETLDQARFLKENHCDMIQGYFFYKPMPMDELEKLIE
jgi:EAL domain-containing protein (putative c-di-GMP-specific phosphodiesterase class I)